MQRFEWMGSPSGEGRGNSGYVSTTPAPTVRSGRGGEPTTVFLLLLYHPITAGLT